MLSVFARLLQWARSLGQHWFLNFGLHCATHQIRVILISGVVITSLFYPALALYASSLPKLSNLVDALSPLKAFSAINAQEDLVNLWSNYDSLRTHEGAVARAKCTPGRALRVERILIQSPRAGDDDTLNNRILTSTLDFEDRLGKLIAESEDACLEKPGGGCLVLSPLAFWDYDRNAVSSDDDILDTLSHTENVTIAGIPVSPHMILAGRGSYEGHVAPSKFDYASLALTYFFPDSECLGNQEHARWVQMVSKAASPDTVSPQTQEPTLMALDFNQNLQTGSTAISTFLYFAYASFLVYVVWSFGRMSAVHSRLGVTFTALVEITVSTITSLSVCALVGFRITMVPWELLPIVIVFVGAENMFNLVDAVGKTSVSLPVKRRIAEGLSKAGTSNTLKVMASNAVLGVIAFFAVGAVRQFCAFAIVVLTAHWFLAHTFFIAVLSIDIARLELEELLRHDTSLAPSLVQTSKESSKQSGSKFHRLLKSRAFANSSLVMLLAITATLYYATTNSVPPRPQAIKPLGAVARAKVAPPSLPPTQKPVAEHIWHVLNPEQRPLLHIKIETPTVLTLNPETAGKPKAKEGKFHHRTRRTISSLIWATKIMLLPIGITITLLYSLLLSLLKDTELLETQRHSAPTEVTEDEKSLQAQAHFATLPRAIASDIELAASSKDGKVVVSVGLHNEIVVWNSESGTYVSIDAGDALLSGPSTSGSTSLLTSLTVDDTGSLIAIGTNTGIITVWVLVGGRTTALPVLALNDTCAAVTELHFISTLPTTPSERKLSIPPPSFPVILATYANGAAVRWSVERTPTVTRFAPSREAAIVSSSLLRVSTDNSVLIAFCLDDGTIDLHETGDYTPVFLNDYCIQPGTAFDPVSKLHACRAELNGSVRPIIAAATERGTVTLWDGLTGECISVLDELQGSVNLLRIVPVPNNTCHFCGHPPPESVSVAYSVDHVVRFFNLCINDQLRRCSCSQSQVRRMPVKEVGGRRSRSSSAASSRIGSPLIPRARLATAFEASDFPVSGHGVHSRRASEKEGRRSLEQVQLTVPFPSENADSPLASGMGTPQPWQNMVVVQVGDVTCERGGWDVSLSKFVGIRRRARSQGTSKGGTMVPVSLTPTQGLTKATLERWELWTFDPAFSRLRLSKLSDLSLKPTQNPRRISSSSASGSPPPSPSGDIARLPFTRVSPLSISSSHALAGFGNTVGVFDFSSEF
ncbi:sterol-sensing domain of SREBP cleavage-activation-domain-containing protein [Coprinopsis sp. MPI-PUGE-AT-0042]|nr:sterol-sensing domain of SREBP cleavage-activation-domain-containing protein [Coprinopsis sp. MPI-PUGE-AT-0042]